MRKLLLLVLAFLYVALPVSAQTPTIEANKAFVLGSDHAGDVPTAYRLYIDGVKVGNDLGPGVRTGTVVTIPAPAVAAGSHTAVVSSVYPASIPCAAPACVNGEWKSPALTFTAVVPPNPTAPSQPRILVTGTTVLNGKRVPAVFELAVAVNRRTKAATFTLVSLNAQ